MPSFIESYGHLTPNELLSRRAPIAITDPQLAWLDLPDPSFQRYVSEREPLPFDGVPPSANEYIRAPTFVLCQMHRVWLTLRAVRDSLPKHGQPAILDVGAFPFAIDVGLHEYLGFMGPINATANLPLAPEWQIELDRRNIQVTYANLDAYVLSNTEFERGLPAKLPYPNESFDIVLCAHVIEHLYHPLTMLSEVQRVLKPGGQLVLSTDNALMIEALLRFGYQAEYIHEPVENTAAMQFHFWRGHSRFYSEGDLRKLLVGAGLQPTATRFHEVLYNSFANEYFKSPTETLPEWKAEILTLLPGYRNELILFARKSETLA